MKIIHALITLYAGLVLASASYAQVMDIRLLHATTEHLRPDLLLAPLTLPGAVQLNATFLVGRWMTRPQRRPHTSKHGT